MLLFKTLKSLTLIFNFFSPAVNYSKLQLDQISDIYNGSTELTVEIVGIDQGTPPRGSVINVTIYISNTCLIDERFERTNLSVTANKTSGSVYLRVPGYWVIDYGKFIFIVFYPLASEVAKGYSNATVRPSLRPSVRPSFRPSITSL